MGIVIAELCIDITHASEHKPGTPRAMHAIQQQNAVIVTDKKISQSSDQAKRMIKGTVEALRFIQTNKKESINILAAYAKSDRETTTSMFESYFPAYSHDGSMTNDALQAAVEDAMMRAKIEKAVPVTQVADRTLIAAAQKELGIH